MLALCGSSGFLDVGARAGIVGDANLDRNRIGRQQVARRQNGHALDDVAQLAGISGPGIAFQYFIRFILYLLGMKIVAKAEVVPESNPPSQ